MKPITVALACLVALILMGCDDDTTPAKQHYAKHGKLLFTADEVANAIR